MRDRPATAVFLIIGLMIASALTSFGLIYGLLRYTNSAVLVNWSESTVSEGAEDADGMEEATTLRCSYFTGASILKRNFSSEPATSDGAGSQRADRCPWRVEVF